MSYFSEEQRTEIAGIVKAVIACDRQERSIKREWDEWYKGLRVADRRGLLTAAGNLDFYGSWEDIPKNTRENIKLIIESNEVLGSSRIARMSHAA